jgi:hypothetical protein
VVGLCSSESPAGRSGRVKRHFGRPRGVGATSRASDYFGWVRSFPDGTGGTRPSPGTGDLGCDGGEIIFFRKLAQVDASRCKLEQVGTTRCGLMDCWILD